MDSRTFFWATLVAVAIAGGCDRQEKEAQYSTGAAPVKGTEKPVVPTTPETGKDHGNAAAQKGGSPNAGTAEPNAPR
jgi:hypothetical protein